MPSRLGIFRPEAHEALTETIQAIQRSLKNRNTKVFLDFRLTEHASVAGLLLLHSSIRAAEAENNCQLKKTLIPPKNARVRMIMNRVGFLKPDNYLESQPGFIPLTTDVKGSTFAKKLFANMNTAIYDNKLQKGGPEWDRLQSAIGEAILNVFEHAYDDAKTKPITDRMGYRWWLIAQTFDNQIYIAMIDKGVGIPETIISSAKMKLERLLNRFLRMATKHSAGPDSAGIITAMRYGSSRLKRRLGGRGTGLASVKELVAPNPDGELLIFSNRGEYTYSNQHGEHTAEHPNSIMGTLIQWNISLPNEDRAQQ
jgi:hypothetical protein